MGRGVAGVCDLHAAQKSGSADPGTVPDQIKITFEVKIRVRVRIKIKIRIRNQRWDGKWIHWKLGSPSKSGSDQESGLHMDQIKKMGWMWITIRIKIRTGNRICDQKSTQSKLGSGS